MHTWTTQAGLRLMLCISFRVKFAEVNLPMSAQIGSAAQMAQKSAVLTGKVRASCDPMTVQCMLCARAQKFGARIASQWSLSREADRH